MLVLVMCYVEAWLVTNKRSGEFGIQTQKVAADFRV